MKVVVFLHWTSLAVCLLGMMYESETATGIGLVGCFACGMIRLLTRKR